MIGFISKKKLLKAMNELKESGQKRNNGVQYPPKDDNQRVWNILMQGYEEGHGNFFNGLYSKFFK